MSPVSRETAKSWVSAALQAVNVPRETKRAASTHWVKPERPRIIAVANQKGGVGKTTTTVNLAVALAMHGLRVVVLDLDPQGNASTALGIDHPAGTPSTYDVLLDGAALSSVLAPVASTTGLFCVPATIDLAGSEVELTTADAREFRLRQALAESQVAYDYVLIDCPPSLGLLTLNALVAAREMLIPIQCEYYALEGLAQLLGTVELVQAHLNPALAVSNVLLTMYDGRTRLADQVADEVRGHFGAAVLQSVIPRNIRVSEAPGFGQTVMTYDPTSRGAVAYLHAAREVAERAEIPVPADVGGPPDIEGEQLVAGGEYR